MDLGPLFNTPQIHTDEHGVHRDDSGQAYRALDVDGETAFVPEYLVDRYEEVGADSGHYTYAEWCAIYPLTREAAE